MAWEGAVGLWALILPGAPCWGFLLTLEIPRSTYLSMEWDRQHGYCPYPKSGGDLRSHLWVLLFYLPCSSIPQLVNFAVLGYSLRQQAHHQQPTGCSYGQLLIAELGRDYMGWIT